MTNELTYIFQSASYFHFFIIIYKHHHKEFEFTSHPKLHNIKYTNDIPITPFFVLKAYKLTYMHLTSMVLIHKLLQDTTYAKH